MDKAVILVVEDDSLQRRLIRKNLETEGYTVFEAEDRSQAKEHLKNMEIDLAIVDFKLKEENGLEIIKELRLINPLITPIVVTAFANVENAVAAIKAGAYDYVVKPLDFEKLLIVIERALERLKLIKEVNRLQETLSERFSSRNLIIASSRMEEVARLIGRAARTEATVLITGETGSGKDMVARAIHHASNRRDNPFFAVNLPSIPETLLESELFGAEKGSFTGAHERRIGKFEAADGGTLFLDEIGDLPLNLQVKILRFLQEKEFVRLGSTKVQRADVRIIAATNRDLEEAVREGIFRLDLYYRLNVIRIEVPPLRMRREEIPALVDFFIKKYSQREGKMIQGISREALSALVSYDFPGNVRELENIIERGVVMTDGEILTMRDLSLYLQEHHDQEILARDGSLPEKVRALEEQEIRRALHESRGNKSQAARILGISERVLRYKLNLYKIGENSKK